MSAGYVQMRDRMPDSLEFATRASAATDLENTVAEVSKVPELTLDEVASRHREHWYAVYTSANHEKRVAEQLRLRGIEHFLPQYESVRMWADRKVKLQMPLFPGYLFVEIALANRLRVMQVPGVVHLVGFNGQPAAVPEADLLRVRDFLARGFRAEPHRFLKTGRRVRAKGGPLMGLEGVVVRRKNGSRFIISFDLIQRSMAVDVDALDLEMLP